MLLVHEPNPKVIKAIERLRNRNPKATEDELCALFVKLCNEDEALADIVVDDVFKAECDKIYDELVSGKPIPNPLRKPS